MIRQPKGSSGIETVKVVNVVVSAHTDDTLDVRVLAERLTNCIYEPDIFSGLTFRIPDPKSTIILFSSGRITSVGTSSEAKARLSLQLGTKIIAGILDKELSLLDVETKNVVAMTSLNRLVNLPKLVRRNMDLKYNPNIFPGAIYQMPNKAAVLIFANGSLVISGAKSEIGARRSLILAYRMILRAGCLQVQRIEKSRGSSKTAKI
jgi:transcription initiation factor TFIID TATA-box-binding protein